MRTIARNVFVFLTVSVLYRVSSRGYGIAERMLDRELASALFERGSVSEA